MLRVKKKLSELRYGDRIVILISKKEWEAHISNADSVELLKCHVEDFGSKSRYYKVTEKNYVASLEADQKFMEWLRNTKYSPSNSEVWDAAREAYKNPVTQPGNALQALALAVFRGDQDALLPLVDELIEQGSIPMLSNPRVKELEKALSNLMEACFNSSFLKVTDEFLEASAILKKGLCNNG